MALKERWKEFAVVFIISFAVVFVASVLVQVFFEPFMEFSKAAILAFITAAIVLVFYTHFRETGTSRFLKAR